jgi:hypothetical protein
MLKLSSVALVFLPLSVAACVSTEGPAFDRASTTPLLVGRSIEVNVVDARPHVDSEEFQVSGLTLGFQDQELSPPLDPALADTLRASLKSRLKEGARALRIEITVREATAGWEANAMTEQEQASATLDVAVFDGARLLASGTGTSWGKRSSLDTSASEVRGILAKVIREALFSYLQSPECLSALGAT